MTTDRSVEISGSVQIGAATPAAVRAQAERLLSHPLFRYSQRTCNMLRFIVDRTLKGQHDELKERLIGIMVFGRAPDYDTSNDSIVRVVANEVRKRLSEYYAQPEHGTELRIELPIRSYVAEFRLPEPISADPPAAVQTQASVQPEPSAKSPSPYRWLSRGHVLGAAGVVVLALMAIFVTRLVTPSSQIDRFWAPVVKDQAPALICVGSPFTPTDAQNGAVFPGSPNSSGNQVPFYDSEQRVYVRMLDANAAAQLATFLRNKGKDSQIRPTQGSQLTASQSGPMILYGMALNESAAKLGVDLHYQFRKNSESGQGIRWIEDASKPTSRDWLVDLSAPSEKVSVDYALISRVRDKTTSRWWIGIAGLTGVGTLAASQVVVDQNAMANICAGLPRDWDRKNLQIVLEIRVAQGEPGATRVLTSYSW
jgi:hypothetical protein